MAPRFQSPSDDTWTSPHLPETFTMDETSTLPPHFNLTGQVEIRGYIPDFRGNYSCVYRGLLRGEFVAVKIIQSTGEPESMKRVLRERFVWGSANHRNIHPFYGFADDTAFGPFGALVSPWSAKGDASRFLRENGERMMIAERINLWKGVIEGVIYLHDQAPPIVHGDLKPGNVLIDDFGVPRICDFGLARIFLEQGSTGMTTTSEHTGTARYLAPELAASDVTVYPTLASDVYALGCLGLEFIYLQQPFSNHVNNLRGQIFRDLRRGLPPAAQRPQQAWPSIRAWPILVNCWNSDPLSRPSAFTAGRTVRCAVFTFPLVVVRRIIRFVDIEINGRGYIRDDEWNQRCRCLRNLCLASRAYRKCTTPVLYREIQLNLEKQPQHLPALLSALDSSGTKVLLSPQDLDGYGICTKVLSLHIARHGPYHPNLSLGIRDLVNRLPGLQLMHLMHFQPNNYVFPLDVPTLSTLSLSQIDLAILFDHVPTIQALESVQRLSIDRCHDSGSSTRPSRQPFSRVYLPNLLEIYLQSYPTRNPFSIISNWTMPGLRSLHLMDYHPFASPFPFLYPLLQTHGAQLQTLTLRCPSLPHQDTLDLLNLCSGLRSLEVTGEMSLSGLFSSHPRLEKVRANYRSSWDELNGNAIVLEPLKSLRLKARTSFPNLVEAEISFYVVRSSNYQQEKAFFRTVDQSITYWDGNKTYRLNDGEDTLVGAYLS